MSIWERLADLDDAELRTLVAATVQTLLESQGDRSQLPNDLPSISTLAASREVLPLLRAVNPAIDTGTIQHAIEDEKLSREICLAILSEIRKSPELAASIESNLNATKQKLSSPELILLAGALLVLAIKIKEVRAVIGSESKSGRRELVIKFYESSAVLKKVVADLVSLAHG